MAATAPTTSRRTASREARRQQLIDATMKCIARKGMSSTTLSDVAKEAGLSQGIVNLHFESKDNLLAETLATLAGEYREKFDKALRNAGPAPPTSCGQLWSTTCALQSVIAPSSPSGSRSGVRSSRGRRISACARSGTNATTML